MKPRTLPVKRLPMSKGIFKRLSAVTGNRKQRVAASATSDMEFEDGSSKISRALTIIFLVHIVAIGLIFIHQKFLDGRAPEEPSTAAAARQELVPTVASNPARLDLPRLATGEKPYIVRQGDNYARIASVVGVEESDLRLINKHADIKPGLLLKIPPKRIAAVEPQEVAAIRKQSPVVETNDLVAAVDVSNVPKAQLVKANPPRTAQAVTTDTPAAVSGKTYIVRKGDSVWRIAHQHKVSEEAVLKANGLKKNQTIQPGMSLAIPR